MRIAVLIVTLLLGVVLFVQTFLVASLGGAINDTESAGAGAVGLLVALLWLIAAAFVIGIPMVSVIVFIVAGMFGLAMGAASDFTDLTIWGVASLVLAALAFLGWLGKRRGERKAIRQQAERDERLAANIRASMGTSPITPTQHSQITCSQCGSTVPASSRFCQDCGAQTSQTGGRLQPSNS